MLEILSLIIQFFKNNLETIITLCSLLFVAIQTRTLSRTYKYLTLVQLLYYYIAIQNKNEKDKFYTNVIELFEKWRTIDKENEKKISNAISRPLPIKK